MLSGFHYGRPQQIASLFLLLFLAQCLWFAHSAPLSDTEIEFIRYGRLQWQQLSYAGAPGHSPLTALLGSFPSFLAVPDPRAFPSAFRLMARLPFIAAGLLLAASLWYVARRLYGNAGGYIALGLYVTSASVVAESARVAPEPLLALGAFGVIFNAIAATHTLYAPLTWKQRLPRVVLLGVSIGLALAAEYVTVFLLPLALAYMLYLVPGRRLAALAVFAQGLALGFVLLLAAWFFSLPAMLSQLAGAQLFLLHPRQFSEMPLWTALPLAVLAVLALAAWRFWRRTRYFGNTAPLLAFMLLAIVTASKLRDPLPAVSILVFLITVIAGVFADLLESRRRSLWLGILVAAFVFQVAAQAWVLPRLLP